MDDIVARDRVETEARRDQHGALSRDQALEAGMRVSQIDRRLRRGQWVPAGPRCWYLLSLYADDPLGRLYAATSSLTAPAWGQSALALHGLAEHPAQPMIALHRRYRGRGVTPIWVEGLEALPRCRRSGIPTLTVETAIASQSRWRSTSALHRLIDEALRTNMTTWARMESALRLLPRRGRAGSSRLRLVLDQRLDDPGVPLSDWGRNVTWVLHQAGLTGARIEWQVTDSSGAMVAQVDLAYPERRYAIELDSIEFHANLEAFELDRQRDAELGRLGWTVRRFTWKQWDLRRAWVIDIVADDLRRTAPT